MEDANEEPTDFPSKIIQILSDYYDSDFSEKDKVRIKTIKTQIHENDELIEYGGRQFRIRQKGQIQLNR